MSDSKVQRFPDLELGQMHSSFKKRPMQTFNESILGDSILLGSLPEIPLVKERSVPKPIQAGETLENIPSFADFAKKRDSHHPQKHQSPLLLTSLNNSQIIHEEPSKILSQISDYSMTKKAKSPSKILENSMLRSVKSNPNMPTLPNQAPETPSDNQIGDSTRRANMIALVRRFKHPQSHLFPLGRNSKKEIFHRLQPIANANVIERTWDEYFDYMKHTNKHLVDNPEKIEEYKADFGIEDIKLDKKMRVAKMMISHEKKPREKSLGDENTFIKSINHKISHSQNRMEHIFPSLSPQEARKHNFDVYEAIH
jgi:hypothetical protein